MQLTVGDGDAVNFGFKQSTKHGLSIFLIKQAVSLPNEGSSLVQQSICKVLTYRLKWNPCYMSVALKTAAIRLEHNACRARDLGLHRWPLPEPEDAKTGSPVTRICA